jgi:hypothetical protein
MLNELFILQILSFVTLVFFICTVNLQTLWYLTGLYLVFLGCWFLLDDGDIFIGFLWVIDLGVGLVFFIFILHYSTFLHYKAVLDKSSRELCFIFFAGFFVAAFLFFFANPIDVDYTRGFQKTWFFLISWYDYYDFFFCHVITDLNLLREIYFYNNSCEFLIINFMLFFAIITSILLVFLVKRIFSFLNYSQLVNYEMLNHVNTSYFIRSQNFIRQQFTSTGTRVWSKKKNNHF